MVHDRVKSNNKTSKGKSPNSEEDDTFDLDHTSRCRKKLLCELELLRQYGCQGKISSVVVGVQQASLYAFKEKLIQQENICRANHAKHLQDEQEMYYQLREEELEARKRQEQIAYEHEQHAKRVHEINQMLQEAERKQKEAEEEERKKLLEKKTHIDQCHSYVSEYRSNYEKIVEILKTCKDKQALVASISSSVSRLKQLSESMDNQIPEKCRTGSVSTEDVEASFKAVEEAKNMAKHFHEEVERINKEHQSVLEQKADLPTPTVATGSRPSTPFTSLAPRDNQPALEAKEAKPASVLNEFVDKDAFKAYSALKEFHEEFTKLYEGLVKDERMKKFKFDCQKAVNIPVNAIAPTSASHLQDKLTKLHHLLSGKSVEVGRANFSAAQHPQGIAFCKDLLARKFVGQGETTVSSKPEAAFAIAAVIVALWVDFPDFGQLLLAHFYKECPYLVPIFMPQLQGQTDVQYYKSLGYRYSECGEVEKQDKFLKRMSGIMHLYCAIIVTPLRRASSRPHPLGLGEAWRWLACMVNMEPRPDVCATLLYDYLEVTGHFLLKHYGPMFQKMLHLLCTEYFLKMEKVTPSESRGPVARLESYLQKILKERLIAHPVGLLPPNFW